MNLTHRRFRGGRAAASRTLLVVAALGAATTSLPVAAEGPPGVEGVILSGPTGSRSGVPLSGPTAAPDAATIPAFDTYGREPALTIASMGDAAWAGWQVTALPAANTTAERLDLASGITEVPLEAIELLAPPPGEWLVSATLDGIPSGTWGWRLVVPDRTVPVLLPAPDIVLFGGGATFIAERGSGCYLRLCGDIGRLPPDRTLPLIRLDRADEPLLLTLSDGSGIVRASVSAVRLNVDETAPVDLMDGAPFAATNLLVLPPPGPGRWRLMVLLTFSDGRGDQAAYARVEVP